MELEQILELHGARYPLMEPADAVKLIYQNEFGAGHLVPDAKLALEYLRREYASVKKDPAAPLYESIGNGIVRVNLRAVPEESLDSLGRAFLQCAGNRKGELSAFLEKLEILRRVTARGSFAFSSGQLEAYFQDYEKAGWPMVSHSSTYREHYRPAYRIVEEKGEFAR